MAPSTPTLAICSGPTVTTWDCRQSGESSVSFRPHGPLTPVTDIAWNHNGQVLASCAPLSSLDAEDNVTLTSMLSQTQLESFQHDIGLQRPPSTPTSISFGGKSRYLCIGDASGAVCLWDLKKKARVRHYFHKGQCLHATLDPTDAHVMSLAADALHVFRLREGTLAQTLPSSSSSLYTVFHASLLEPSRVAIGSQSGNLFLWDLVAPTEPLAAMTAHTDTVTGVAFSSVNRLLLASTSLDATLAFSDTAGGKTIQRVKLDSPCSCLSLHQSGGTCAVGTVSGDVHVYDLRQLDTPLATWKTKEESVPITAVHFTPTLRITTTTTATASHTRSQVMAKSSEQGSSPGTNGDSAEKAPLNASVEDLSRVVDSVLNRPAVTRAAKVATATTGGAFDQEVVQEMIHEAVDAMRDDLEGAIRNVHVDMLRQFQMQSIQFTDLLSKQMVAMETLMEENDRLRKENSRLRQAHYTPT